MGGSDNFRIRVYDGGDTTNTHGNGIVEIATCDDGNEPIYVRQYTGNTDFGNPSTIVHEACLLDANGNTTFPDTVTAKSYNGTTTSSVSVCTLGRTPVISSGPLPHYGLTMQEAYRNGYPIDYGNVINIQGSNMDDTGHPGIGQLLCGWPGDSTADAPINSYIYYRSKRDAIDKWSNWDRLAFIKDVTAVNTGGIIAQSLDANGYVKFANGLIIQWGVSTTNLTNKSDINYHVAFNNIPYYVSASTIDIPIDNDTNSNLSIYVLSYDSTTKFKVYHNFNADRFNFTWFAIGI